LPVGCEEFVKVLAVEHAPGAWSDTAGGTAGASGSGRSAVRDVVYVVLLAAFFAVSVSLVWVCERIVGGGEAVALAASAEPARDEVAA
jgi:hypothetical protein